MRLLLALLCYLPSVIGHDDHIEFAWTFAQGNNQLTAPPQDIHVDDNINFVWSGDRFHDVYIHPTADCTETNRERVGTASPAEYTIKEADAGTTVTFACDVGNHCEERGMRLDIEVSPETWYIPDNDIPLPSRTVKVGDTITFIWTETHDVYIHPNGGCTTSGRIKVGMSSGATYTFTEDDIGDIVFACDIGDHCDKGMMKTVKVEAKLPVFGGCFSGDDRVQVESKGSVEMAALQIGDHVLVSGNKYEPVYSFGHRDATSSAEYLKIHSDGINDPLKISHDHMILSGGEHWVPAATLRVGDTLTKGDGGVVVVTKILQDVTQKGIFAPFTTSGSIVVNDIVASNFIAFQGSEYLQIGDFATPFTFQWLSHSFESGHHLACSSGFVDCDQETYTDSGVSHWADTPHQVARWWLQQHAAVTLVLLVPLVLVFGFLAVLEHPVWLCTFLAAVMLARSFRAKNGKMTA